MAQRKPREASPSEQIASLAQSLAQGAPPRAVVLRGDERWFRIANNWLRKEVHLYQWEADERQQISQIDLPACQKSQRRSHVIRQRAVRVKQRHAKAIRNVRCPARKDVTIADHLHGLPQAMRVKVCVGAQHQPPQHIRLARQQRHANGDEDAPGWDAILRVSCV